MLRVCLCALENVLSMQGIKVCGFYPQPWLWELKQVFQPSKPQNIINISLKHASFLFHLFPLIICQAALHL